MIKYIYITLGTASLVLGILGIITPGLPTTPFILLTGFCYARSSPRLYKKLEQNRITGMYLRGINEGFSLRMRIIFLSIMWLMILMTVFFIFNTGKMRYLMIGLGIIGTISQLLLVKKKKKIPQTVIQKQNSGI